MGSLAQDIRLAARMVRRNAGLSIAIILTLGLGIGANAAIFTIVNAYLLRPLPFADADRLVHVWRTMAGADFGDSLRVAEGDFLDLQASATAFSDLGAYDYWTATLTDVPEPYGIQVTSVTWNLPRVLAVQPAMGRWFREDDASRKVAIASHAFWQGQLNANPQVLGRTVELDGHAYEIVGVMPPSFVFPFSSTRLWVCKTLQGRESRRGPGGLLVVGRLATGIRQVQAEAQVGTVAGRLAAEHPENRDLGFRVVPLRQALLFFFNELRTAALGLLGAAAFLLLIVCSNVASLLVARGAARRREVAVRTAIGASRARLIRQFLVEGGLLALLGGAFGTLAAATAAGAIGQAIPEDMYRAGELAVDGRVLAFVIGLSMLSVLLFALTPALGASRVDLAGDLKEGTPISGQRSMRTRSALIVLQLAFAMVLLFGTAASLLAFDALRRVSPGFDADGVVAVELNLPFGQPRYATAEQWNRFYDQLVERLRSESALISAATVMPLPMDWQVHFQEFTAADQPAGDRLRPSAARYHVSPGYFEAMGIPIVAGRTFTDRDRGDSPLVVVVNRRLAERFWPDHTAVGQRLMLHEGSAPDQTAEVIGVVADSKDFMMHEESRPQIFFSQPQRPFSGRFLVVRGAADARSPAATIRDHVRALDPALPIGDVRRLSYVVFQSVMPFAAVATVLGGLGMTALFLVGVGLYGLISFSMRQRTREIGLRMALGASGRQVVTLVLGQGLVLVGAGLVLGIILVAAPTVAAERLLATGPLLGLWPLVAATLALAAAGMAAAWLPARRAARIEPAAALRDE